MKVKFWSIFLGLTLWLAGCAQAFPTAQVSNLPTEVPTEAAEVVEVPAEPTEEREEATPETVPPTSESGVPESGVPESGTVPADPTATIPAEPTTAPATEAPSQPTGLGSPDLHATDPTTVSLASGKVQLVEFFAFW
ncbi:MAG: hypothetical protein HUU38_16045 [Anaerolineales bacterium]|nr:hypothetical protein [Anaerolineales bacterium]